MRMELVIQNQSKGTEEASLSDPEQISSPSAAPITSEVTPAKSDV